ncbi:hypothetical protein BGZ60DRAFT_523678 [Tricladium varicosporioides]|nr:hypothetical protein BGZ60DRAFT_523678 [Hymenoscyphus varicosporioides]
MDVAQASGNVPDEILPHHHLNPHEQAPKALKNIYKSWTVKDVPSGVNEDVINTSKLCTPGIESVPRDILSEAFEDFVRRIADHRGFHRGEEEPAVQARVREQNFDCQSAQDLSGESSLSELEIYARRFARNPATGPDYLGDMVAIGSAVAYNVEEIPGLTILPGLLPAIVQQTLLECLLHRELSRPENKTNLHLHYNITYPQKSYPHSTPGKADADTFFSTNPLCNSFQPKNPGENKALTNYTVLEKSLRWITLGGQYDWTKKEYPNEVPPKFPEDIARLVEAIFTDMKAQAAIVNLYSAKDKLSLHRDVSEEADRGLVSISLGCSCIFVIGTQDKQTGELHHKVLMLNSGDVVYMSGESRFAWHGVPKILPDTCPDYLRQWPGPAFPEWQEWMTRKRINLNIRQMFE